MVYINTNIMTGDAIVYTTDTTKRNDKKKSKHFIYVLTLIMAERPWPLCERRSKHITKDPLKIYCQLLNKGGRCA